ncbi:MAG TPA: glycosyltransferase family 4 protein [Pseudomonadales bacterium]
MSEHAKNAPCRQRLLVITRNLPPLRGGMERLVWHIVDELAVDYDVHVIGPAGCRQFLPQGVSATELAVRPLPLFLLACLVRSVFLSLRLRPARVLAGSGLTAPFAWLAARLAGGRWLVYLHGLDIQADSRFYQAFWPRFFGRADIVLVNSHFTFRLAEQAGVDAARIRILHPGVQLPDTAMAAQQRQVFRDTHQLGNRPLMLYVGRIVPRKGLLAFVEQVLPAVLAQCPDAMLLVVGEEPDQALLKSSGETAKVIQRLDTLGLHQSVRFLGSPDDQALSMAYFAADVLVFPVQQQVSDNEGFGMVAIEAAAHGLPTVAFAAGGVPDAVADGVSGWLLPPGDFRGMSSVITQALSSCDRGVDSVSCQCFASGFGWQQFGARLRDFFVSDG